MTNVLGRIPAGVPILVTAINDQSATGMLRAAKQGGREADLLVVGMGADEVLEECEKEQEFVGCCHVGKCTSKGVRVDFL